MGVDRLGPVNLAAVYQAGPTSPDIDMCWPGGAFSTSMIARLFAAIDGRALKTG